MHLIINNWYRMSEKWREHVILEWSGKTLWQHQSLKWIILMDTKGKKCYLQSLNGAFMNDPIWSVKAQVLPCRLVGSNLVYTDLNACTSVEWFFHNSINIVHKQKYTQSSCILPVCPLSASSNLMGLFLWDPLCVCVGLISSPLN
jgi:hypothetical protein